MATKRNTVLLLHEQLPQTTPTWDDNLLCAISSNTHKQVNTMPGNNPEIRGLPTCTLNQRGHVRISTIKYGSGRTLQKGGFHYQSTKKTQTKLCLEDGVFWTGHLAPQLPCLLCR